MMQKRELAILCVEEARWKDIKASGLETGFSVVVGPWCRWAEKWSVAYFEAGVC